MSKARFIALQVFLWALLACATLSLAYPNYTMVAPNTGAQGGVWILNTRTGEAKGCFMIPDKSNKLFCESTYDVK